MKNAMPPFTFVITFVLLAAMPILTGCGAGSKEIIQAVEVGDLDKVKELVEAKPKLANAVGNTGMTPLHWAAAKGHGKIIEYLIFRNADVNKTNLLKETPLDVAERKRKNAMVALLAEHGGKSAKELGN